MLDPTRSEERRREDDQFWSTVRRTFETMEKMAPEGWVPRIFVTLADGEILEPAGGGRAGSRVYFEIEDENEDGAKVTEDHRVVFVPPESILRVEVRFREQAGHRVGFRLDEPIFAEVGTEE
jgi:hypothetical protein